MMTTRFSRDRLPGMINQCTAIKDSRLIMVASAILCWLLLSSCATAISQPPLQPADTEPSVTRADADIKTNADSNLATHKNLATNTLHIQQGTKDFTPETLYSLLTAEIAGSREQYDIALNNYVQQAKETRDPQVAERATLIARYLGNNTTALEMAQIWVEAAPRDTDALANASMAYLQMGRLDDAFSMSERLFRAGGEPLFQNIAANAANLNDIERTNLLQNYATLIKAYPAEEQLLVGAALLLQQMTNYDEALNITHRALKQNPRSIPAAILEANLLHQLKRDKEAIAKMAQLLEFYPDNTSLRQQYARILTHHDMGLAQEQLVILSKQQPTNGDVWLSLGIVSLELKDIDTARQAFETLLDQDQHLSSAHYYLGHIAEARSDLPEAVIHYLQVENGNDFLSATMSVLDIFIRQKDFLSAQQHLNRLRLRRPEQSESLYLLHTQILNKYQQFTEAQKTLNEGVLNHPDSTRLLFARAMLSNQRQQLAATERDLRQILQFDPKHVAALNSLGYILADRTQRFDEAFTYLQKALELSPDDAAIQDSMGWLHYRTGKYPEALAYLRKAYASMPTSEIGAHLGEILWVIGDKEAARKIWQESITLNPQDPVIRETLNRLKADL